MYRTGPSQPEQGALDIQRFNALVRCACGVCLQLQCGQVCVEVGQTALIPPNSFPGRCARREREHFRRVSRNDQHYARHVKCVVHLGNEWNRAAFANEQAFLPKPFSRAA